MAPTLLPVVSPPQHTIHTVTAPAFKNFNIMSVLSPEDTMTQGPSLNTKFLTGKFLPNTSGLVPHLTPLPLP